MPHVIRLFLQAQFALAMLSIAELNGNFDHLLAVAFDDQF
jgi:hypothetical protein